MRELKTSLKIAAEPAKVWKALIEASAYPEWNPQIIRVEGEFGPQESLQIVVPRPSGKGRPHVFPVKVTVFEPQRILEWEGGIPGIFIGRHRFTLEPVEGGTLLRNEEQMRGLYPLLAGQKRIDALKPNYEGMNRALAQRVGILNK